VLRSFLLLLLLLLLWVVYQFPSPQGILIELKGLNKTKQPPEIIYSTSVLPKYLFEHAAAAAAAGIIDTK
jgi:hypothetical protein